MNQGPMSELIAGALGGKVNDAGEIEATNFEVIDAAQPEQGNTPPPKTEEAPKSEEAPKETPKATETLKVEEPKGEIKEESSLTNKSFEELLAEKSGGKFKSWEEIETLSMPKQEYANDLVAKLNEFSKKFEDPNTAFDLFLKTQTADFTQLADVDAIKMKLKMENPELSDKEIDYEFKTTYKVDADSYDEETVELANLKLARDAKKAKDDLVKTQQELALNGDRDEAKIAAQNKAWEESRNNWNKSVDDSATQLEKMDIKISDKDSLEWKFSQEERSEAIELTKSMHDDTTKFFELFKNEKGGYDHGKIASAYLKLKKFEDIIGAAVEQAKSVGTKTVVADLKNTDFSGAKQGNTPAARTVEEQVAEQFFKRM